MRIWLCAVTALLALGTACAQAPASQAPPAPLAAAPAGPSEQARMVCEKEAQDDIAVVLGVTASQVGPMTFAGHTTSCRYAYPDGAFDLTVQDLPDDPATTAAYDALGNRLGRTQDLDLPGASAFTTPGGSVVLRKDTKVMLVDVTALPATFGRPAVARSEAALLIMKAVLDCWTG